eukprot:augustus_masked-scaffold_14-processed-gene-1.49-mRNA-1 protein AED:1.00 eAED:1.00 QI:0/-1/0/0/-1/1/1/0/440
MTSITLAACPSPHSPKPLQNERQSSPTAKPFSESKFSSLTLGNWNQNEDQVTQQLQNDGISHNKTKTIKREKQTSPVSGKKSMCSSAESGDLPSIQQQNAAVTSDSNGVLFQNLADFDELSLNPKQPTSANQIKVKSESTTLPGLDVGRRFELGAPIDPYGNVGTVPGDFPGNYVVKHNERRRYSQTPKRKSQSLYEKSTSSAEVYGKGYSRASFSEAKDIRASHQFFQQTPGAPLGSGWQNPGFGGEDGDVFSKPLFDGSVKSSSSETLRTNTSRYKHLSIDTTITDFDTIPFPVDLGQLQNINTEGSGMYGMGYTEPKLDMYAANYYPQRKKRASVIETKTDMNMYSDYSFNETESSINLVATGSKDRKARPSTSIYRGVSRCGKDQKYQARLRVKGKVMYLGRFKDEIEAAKCYDRHAKRHLGADAKLNFPEASGSE